mmetsp:Transcript_15109/g.38855  ORF Transcript_15109/g.38855 Transcript_15109/m.38855 type:complete len:231 (-) Transcript_15109:2580-3272(-)
MQRIGCDAGGGGWQQRRDGQLSCLPLPGGSEARHLAHQELVALRVVAGGNGDNHAGVHHAVEALHRIQHRRRVVSQRHAGALLHKHRQLPCAGGAERHHRVHLRQRPLREVRDSQLQHGLPHRLQPRSHLPAATAILRGGGDALQCVHGLAARRPRPPDGHLLIPKVRDPLRRQRIHRQDGESGGVGRTASGREVGDLDLLHSDGTLRGQRGGREIEAKAAERGDGAARG